MDTHRSQKHSLHNEQREARDAGVHLRQKFNAQPVNEQLASARPGACAHALQSATLQPSQMLCVSFLLLLKSALPVVV